MNHRISPDSLAHQEIINHPMECSFVFVPFAFPLGKRYTFLGPRGIISPALSF